MKPYLVLIIFIGLSACIELTLAKSQTIQKRFHFGGKVKIHDVFFAPMLWRPIFSAYEYKCGGTWIHQRFALTSAYCLKYHDTINYVGFLTADNGWEVVNDNRYWIEKKLFYPGYSYEGNKKFDNNIGLVKIRGYKSYNPLGYFPKFYFGDWTDNPFAMKSSPCVIFGFGKTESGSYATHLKYMKTKLHFDDPYTEDNCNIAAVRERKAMCLAPTELEDRIDNGDYGSPVYFNVKNPEYLYYENRIIIGIISFQLGLPRNIVITNTSYYRKFIEDTIKHNSYD